MNNWKSTDGYLLFDFSDVNPALTNQIVDGIYERAKNLIANNKFVLLVNEGVHTPIPAVVAYVNQAYVIETVLYAYTITSNDNVKKTNHEYGAATLEDMTDVSILNPVMGDVIRYDSDTNYWINGKVKSSELNNDAGFITSADVPTIDDTTVSDHRVWSSEKVNNELLTKADNSSVPTKTSQLTNDSGFVTSSEVPTKTSQLTNDSGFLTSADVPVIDDTAVVNNKVWSSSKISSELLGKQNTLTAGTGIDITSNTVSLDINGLTSVSTLNGTDEIAVYDGTGEKKTTTAAVLGLANVPQFEPLTTIDNNKLLGVSVSGSDISVGAVSRSLVEYQVGDVFTLSNANLLGMSTGSSIFIPIILPKPMSEDITGFTLSGTISVFDNNLQSVVSGTFSSIGANSSRVSGQTLLLNISDISPALTYKGQILIWFTTPFTITFTGT